MAYKTADGTWRANVRLNGRKFTRNFRTKLLAETWEHELRIGAERPNDRPKYIPTFAEFFRSWLEDYAKVEREKTTVKLDESRAKNHLIPALGKLPLDRIRTEHCLELRRQLAAKLAPSTANIALDLARLLFKVAVQKRLIRESPWLGVKRLKEPEQAFEFWTPIERDRFLAFARRMDSDVAELVTVMVHTGLRAGEVHALQRRHLDLDTKTLLIQRTYHSATRETVDRTKAGKIDSVPLNEAAFRVLQTRALLSPDAPLFSPTMLERARRRTTTEHVKRMGSIQRIAIAAGVRDIHFHALRHTFASCLVLSDVDIYTVQRLMRHADIKQTIRYAHLTKAYLAVAAEKLVGPDLAPQLPNVDAEREKTTMKLA